MEELIRTTLAPALATLLAGGGIFHFLLAVMRRRYDSQDRRDNDGKTLAERNRMYEIAYRRGDAYCRNLTQVAGEVARAHMMGDTQLMPALLDILAHMMGSKNANGQYELSPFPDFLGQARQEVETVDGD